MIVSSLGNISGYGPWVSVGRTTTHGHYSGDQFGRGEALDMHTAPRSMAIWAPRQLFLQMKVGSIEFGKLPDPAVWARDRYAVPTATLKEIRCMLTIFHGQVVYTRLNGPF